MKSILFACILFGLLIGLLVSATSLAQTACPPGMEEYGAGVCGYSQSQEPQQQVPQQAPRSPLVKWESRWGAIVTDAANGVLGEATDMPSKSDAEQTAVADCVVKGGSVCKLEIAYDNECAALIVSKSGHVVTADATEDQAVQAGMKTCTDAGYFNCHAGYTACSLPVRIQ